MGLTKVRDGIKHYRKCWLWKMPKAVPGECPSDAKVLLVGQNPVKQRGAGRPFAGRAGKSLGSVLKKHAVQRSRLFITTVIKHNTLHNRIAGQNELNACLAFLLEQIKLIKLKLIVLLERLA